MIRMFLVSGGGILLERGELVEFEVVENVLLVRGNLLAVEEVGDGVDWRLRSVGGQAQDKQHHLQGQVDLEQQAGEEEDEQQDEQQRDEQYEEPQDEQQVERAASVVK